MEVVVVGADDVDVVSGVDVGVDEFEVFVMVDSEWVLEEVVC